MQSVVDSPLLAQTCPVPVPYCGRNIYEVALQFVSQNSNSKNFLSHFAFKLVVAVLLGKKETILPQNK